MPSTLLQPPVLRSIELENLRASSFSQAIYGRSSEEIDDLVESIRAQGVLVPPVVTHEGEAWEIVSGHRRIACARALGFPEVFCEVRSFASREERQRAVLEYNRQRRKSFSQLMREADALESLQAGAARGRRLANLRQFAPDSADGRNSDDRRGRTDTEIARALGLGGKDLYRQARAIWKAAQSGDTRAGSGVSQLDAGTKTVHSAYKDLRRRDRFSAGFRPTPYDVWAFKHDPAFGIPHPGAIPPSIVAHALHYYTVPGALVVDPMAGGGTTLDVCESMGRHCLAYDLDPVRPDVVKHDVKDGFPLEARGCDFVFADPPYHTMLARKYGPASVDHGPLTAWIAFLEAFSRAAFATIRPGGYLALLVANQTEKDLPAGFGYLDHAFYGYNAMIAAGFLPERRVSCPMSGAYLPQQVRSARTEGRMLGQVRDLLIVRKPLEDNGLGNRLATRQLVDLGTHEGVRESRVAADDRLR